jgi:single-stranded DNA-binding protein
MNLFILTDAIISQGFDGKPAFRFNDNKTAVNFKVGYRVYDKNAPNNHRYVNFAVKAYNPICERIEKMKIKEGSRIHITGSIDEETWDDKESGQKITQKVIIAEKIEYASSANENGKSNGNGSNGTGSATPDSNGNGQGTTSPTAPTNQNQQNSSGDQNGTPDNFT